MLPDSVFHSRLTMPVSHERMLVVVLIYAILASAWILLSDKLVQMFVSDPDWIILISMLKGWIYVAVTSVLLYVLMRHWVHGDARPAALPGSKRLSQRLFMIMAVIILALTAVGVGHTIHEHKAQELARLQAIADLKARQVADWLGERQNDAEFVRRGGFFPELHQRWQASVDTASGQQLQEQLEQLCRNRGFAAAMLLDSNGQRLWGSNKASPAVTPLLQAEARIAAAEGKLRRVGPYRDTAGNPRLDFIVPLADRAGRISLIALQIDLDEWLFPTLRNGPFPSSSGETLVFRREGDQVLFLSPLRHQNDAALRLRLPVATEKLLAALALRGEVELGKAGDGVDYRGVATAGVVRAIAGSDWFLIAKLDRSEVYAEAVRDGVWVGFAGMLMLFMTGAAFHLQRQGQLLADAQLIHQSQTEHLRALRLLAAIADSSCDVIFAKDLQGRYILFNREAERVTGKNAASVLGRDDYFLFPAAQAEAIMNNDREVIAEARSVTYQEDVSTADGEVTFLSTKGPLFDADDSIVGMFGISRDITELKRAELALRDSESRFRALVEQSLAGIYIIQNSRFRYVNPGFADIFGYDSPAELIDRIEIAELVAEGDRQRVLENIRRIGGEEADMHYAFVGVRRDGKCIDVEVHGRSLVYQGQPAVIGVVLDITARKAAEDSLRQSERRFHDIVNASADWIWETDAEGHYTYTSDSVKALLGYTPQEILGKTPFDLMPPGEAERVRALFAMVCDRHEAFRNLDNINRHKDGSLRHLQTNGMPILNADGMLIGYRGLDQDVTERKQAEALIQRSEAFKRGILDSVSAHLAVLDNQGVIVAVNQPWQRFAEENAARVGDCGVGVNYLDVCLHSTGPSADGAMDARDGIIAVQEGRLPIFRLEYSCHSPNQQRWFVMTVTPLNVEEHAVVISHSDITARKLTEEVLRRQAEELSQRNAELERFNRATVGRELDMIELKRQINALSRQLGREPPFSLSFDVSPQTPEGEGV